MFIDTNHIYELWCSWFYISFQYDYKFVSKHEVSGYTVRLINETVSSSGNKPVLQKDFYINCDGEAIRLQEPVFDVKFHRRVVKFFGDVGD